MKNLFAGSLIIISMATACNPSNKYPIMPEVWVPEYGTSVEKKVIQALPAQDLQTAGKIYAYQNYLFQIDAMKGIHIYKLVNKEPIKEKFIKVWGATEISIKNGIILTNNYKDLVSIDINDMNDIKEVGRVKDAFPNLSYDNIPPERGYFQCVDPSKGEVISWRLEKNVEANCKY